MCKGVFEGCAKGVQRVFSVGSVQCSTGGGLSDRQIIPGWIAQMNVFDRALTDEEVSTMRMFCNDMGNVVNENTITVVGTLETDTEEFECLGC